jgi:glycosyltransferase involved in cell wall biosynthesis
MQRDPLRKLFLLNEALKTLVYEHRIYKNSSFDLFSFVSRTERDYILKKYPAVKAIHSPIGVNDNGSSPNREAARKSIKTLMFIGNLSYFSNIESIAWFVHKVYPDVLKHFENVRLWIVGKQPGRQIYELANAYRNIEVIGDVPSTIPLLSQADIVIAPMISGAGVKVKILEALSARRIVVTTRLGVDGTDLLDGKHLLVADDFDNRGFASKCLEILTQEDSFQNVAETGYNYVTRNYSWEKTVRDFNDEILTALKRKRGNLSNGGLPFGEC